MNKAIKPNRIIEGPELNASDVVVDWDKLFNETSWADQEVRALGFPPELEIHAPRLADEGHAGYVAELRASPHNPYRSQK